MWLSNHTVFYVNNETKTSTWQMPSELKDNPGVRYLVSQNVYDLIKLKAEKSARSVPATPASTSASQPLLVQSESPAIPSAQSTVAQEGQTQGASTDDSSEGGPQEMQSSLPVTTGHYTFCII